MRRARISLQKLYKLVQKYLKKSDSARLRQRGRSQTYSNALILTLWLYQTLYRVSYREVLKVARKAGFSTPSLSTYHYRVRQLSGKLFQKLLAQVEKDLSR